MRRTWVVLAVCVGCALPPSQGKLVSLADGSAIQLDMTFSKWGGHMVGRHPTTGEVFEGDYSATLEGAEGRAGGQNVSARELVARGAGTLVGSRGTVLDCQLNINPGNYLFRTNPTGNGLCTDQSGGRYRLVF